MNDFKLHFTWNHAPQTASVTVLKGADHIQYTITPDDPALEKKFATQVIHQFGNKLEFAFPGQGEETEQYNRSLEKALRQVL